MDYFKNLFTISNPPHVNAVTDNIERRVTAEMNSNLLQPFEAEEVRHALAQMHPSKSPGPDGMPALFYQKFWHVVGRDIENAVLSF